MHEFWVLEVARTGAAAMLRGPGVFRENASDGSSPSEDLASNQARSTKEMHSREFGRCSSLIRSVMP